MKEIFAIGSFLFLTLTVTAQEHGFPFGKVTYKELDMKTYDKDTAAVAVVLNEFGEAYISSDNFNLVFTYHAKIKILKKSGSKYADIEIPILKQEIKSEVLKSVKASAFTYENGSMREIKLDEKNVFTENRYKHLDIKKFAIPNVREGSVIEFMYTLESPFIWNFRNWEFQSDIPKVYSEYWAKIPGNYTYNTTLRGPLKLSKNESSLVKDCFAPGGGAKADCALYKYAMKNIPAFVEEDYMTARSNFISAINFELSEIRYFDGRVDKITKEWKDAELELRREQRFGTQLRRGKDIATEVKQLTANDIDPLTKATKIYDFIKNWYRWNEVYGKYSELGIKKAFDTKTGNVGDINLSLIAALRFADLDVEPVILSTRNNGVPIELHPVISDFNYVIAKVNIGDRSYLADATDDFYPFGLLPERCLNGKGRVLGEEQSYWIDLKPADKEKQLSQLTLKLGTDGVISGTLKTTYMGYEAVRKRKSIHAFNSHQEYINDLGNNLDRIEIKNFQIENADDFSKAVVQTLAIEIKAFDDLSGENFLFNPFLFGKWKENPFKSTERLYPVDFGTPMEFVTILNFEYPEEFEIVNLPEKIALSLPNAGGRYIYEVQNTGNRLLLNDALTISKTIFNTDEYHYLKELFSRIIQSQNADFLFKKKS